MFDPIADIPGFESYIGKLHDRAESIVRPTTEADARDAGALMTLGGIHRAKGNFATARDAYRRASRLPGPDRGKAAWLSAMLRGDRLPHVPPPGLWPAPFVRIMDFLSPAEHRRVSTRVLAMRASFSPARTGVGADRKVRTDKRRGLMIENVADEELVSILVPKVRGMLPEVRKRLRLEAHNHPLSVLHVNAYLDGGFGQPHQDSRIFGGYEREGLFCICFFHRRPKVFSGGDLLLYDTDIEKGCSRRFSFSRIEPVANSMVIYPDGYMHGITPVQCGTDEFADGRFSVVYRTLPDPQCRAPSRHFRAAARRSSARS